MRGLREVFAFTLRQQLKIKSVKILTIVIALVLFVTPIAAMVITEVNRSPEEIIEDVPEEGPEDPGYVLPDDYNADGINSIFCFCDKAGGYVPDLPDGMTIPGCEDAEFKVCSSYTEAKELAKGRNDALIISIRLSKAHGCYEVSAIMPEGAEIPEDKCWYIADYVQMAFGEVLISTIESDPEIAELLEEEYNMTIPSHGESEGTMTPEEALKEETLDVITMFLPYLNIMLVYFLVLYYGQSAANSVILEKTSKLMDTFLISVKPKAMIFGKVLATWTAALIQFITWVVAGIAGFGIGAWAVKLINPESPMVLLKVFSLLKMVTDFFTLGNVIVSILLIIGGFFIYCCMAAIAGSFASKPEELSSTITVFTLTLVVSLFVTLKVGFIDHDMGTGAAWFDFVPFTATLITPSRMLLGNITLATGLLSLLSTAVLSVLFILIAGKTYSMMSLYKGKLPTFKEIIVMVKG